MGKMKQDLGGHSGKGKERETRPLLNAVHGDWKIMQDWDLDLANLLSLPEKVGCAALGGVNYSVC